MSNNLLAEKFTQHLKQALLRAQSLAWQNPSLSDEPNEISSTHLLDSLWREPGSIASEIISKASPVESRQSGAAVVITRKPAKTRLGQEAVTRIIKAVHLSRQYGHKYVGTEHLLKSLTEINSAAVKNWWQKHAINLNDLEKNLHIVLESTSKFPDLTAVFRSQPATRAIRAERLQAALEYFGRELTSVEAQKDIDPVIGRETEINRLIHVLCRRYKNNPLLLGEAGGGKPAMVEGLAKKISQGAVPPILANKKIYTIDLGAIVAGTIYRGEFEARFKNLIESAEESGNVILFIDEIHTIIGAGSASGSLDAANMLKPALARGRVSIIGATTTEEYKKHVETDSALERRLQPIIINEPNAEETTKVLAGIRSNYEHFHNVIITDEAIAAAVALSNRYLTEKLQPDKAIDLIDEAAAKVKVEHSERSIWQKIRKTEATLERALAAKRQAVSNEDYSLAMALKQQESDIQSSLQKLLSEAKKEDVHKVRVERKHVLEVVARLTKIPLGELGSDERDLLSDLEERLRQRIIGQDQPLSKIANLIRRARTQVASPGKPLASFLFLGPSGVGKTETAKQLAATLFRDPKALIRLDMSEFSEGFTLSRLIGAPAGYVGYRDSNKFTDLVRRQPYAVVLLDEIEKAHSEVFNILLQILEDGELSDATGRRVNFRNTVIIMTSNLGLEEFKTTAGLGFGESASAATDFATVAKRVLRETENHFKPEFLNRIDSLIVFNPLAREHLGQIINLFAKEINERLIEKNLSINLTAAAETYILDRASLPAIGARSIRRFFQEQIESELANTLLNEKFRMADSAVKTEIIIDAADNKLIFKAG